jgi:two-component system, NarL family, nitrate/nitrite response regulator NarL
VGIIVMHWMRSERTTKKQDCIPNSKASRQMTNPTRIAVIDDHPMYLLGLERAFRMEPDFAIVSTGGTAVAACTIAVHDRPDVILLDIGIPGNGIKALRTIRRTAPDVRVIMLTASDNQEHVAESLEQGAQGYILKGVHGEQLAVALRSILNGETYVTPSISKLHRPHSINDSATETAVRSAKPLNFRERQILAMAGKGLTNIEISEQINIPIRAVKFNLSTAFEKLGVGNRLAAVLAFKSKYG